MRRFSLSSQDDQPPALTGSNRLFQTTTMYIPNSGKSERSKRHVPRSVHARACQKSRLFTRRKIKYIVPNNNGNWQRQPRANDRRTAHCLIGTVSRCQTRACARSMRRRRAVQSRCYAWDHVLLRFQFQLDRRNWRTRHVVESQSCGLWSAWKFVDSSREDVAASTQHHDRNCCEIRSVYVKDRDLIVIVIRFLVLIGGMRALLRKTHLPW